MPSAWLRAGQPPALRDIVPTRNEADNIRPLLGARAARLPAGRAPTVFGCAKSAPEV